VSPNLAINLVDSLSMAKLPATDCINEDVEWMVESYLIVSMFQVDLE
jgi:hypothetical protein